MNGEGEITMNSGDITFKGKFIDDQPQEKANDFLTLFKVARPNKEGTIEWQDFVKNDQIKLESGLEYQIEI